MLEFLRQNYSQILTLLFIAICIILVIVSFFQKEDPNKKELSLVLYKEKKYNKENELNVNTYALIRKYVLIYQIILFDESKNQILKSNIYTSKEKALDSFDFFKTCITESNIIYQTTFDNLHYCIYVNHNKVVAYTKAFDTISELNNCLNKINKLSNSPIISIPQFDNSIESYNRLNKPKKVSYVDLIKKSDIFKISLIKNNLNLLESFESKDKNFLKSIIPEVEEALLKKRFYIENIDEKYHYILLSSSYQILSFGPIMDSKEDVINALDDIYNQILTK